MDIEKRQQRAIFHQKLVDLLSDCKNDGEFYQRLIWVQEIITNSLADFIQDFELE